LRLSANAENHNLLCTTPYAIEPGPHQAALVGQPVPATAPLRNEMVRLGVILAGAYARGIGNGPGRRRAPGACSQVRVVIVRTRKLNSWPAGSNFTQVYQET